MNFPGLARQAWRMLRRDWRAAELHLLSVALVLAVAALSSVGFLADRMRLGLAQDAHQMLGADLVVRGDAPLAPDFAQHATQLGLRTAQTAVFPSMVTAVPADGGEAPGRLVSLKAVSSGYPLRGQLRIARTPGDSSSAGVAADGIPAPGTVWVDRALLEALHLQLGGTVRIGTRSFVVGARITREMDRGFGFSSLAPRVMMRLDELPSTGLVQFGSRITYRLLVAGASAPMAAYQRWAEPVIRTQRGVQLETLQGQPQMQQTLERADRFLSLVALLAAVLAAVAIGIAAHRYSARHLDSCAVMRCLGIGRGALRAMVALEFIYLGAAGSALGVLAGYVVHGLLLHQLSGLVPADLPPPSWRPAALGVASGLSLLLGFALPPLLPLARVSPLRALRREWGGAARSGWLAYGLSGLVFAGLLLFAARNVRLGAMVAGGFVGGALVFGLLAWLSIGALARWAHRPHAAGGRGIGWRYAIAGLHRRGLGSALQVVALTLGLMALLLLAITRNDLIAGWRQSTPPGAPNRFVIDIQTGQQAQVARQLQTAGMTDAKLWPMVKARLTGINGRAVTGANYTDPRARRLAEREFNLSYTNELPPDDRIEGGQWFGASAGAPQISLEAGIAKTLGVKLGDHLRFEVAGQVIEAPVTSLRKVDWGSMRVNFFVLMPPSALQDFPATWITAFHLAPGQQHIVDNLLRAMPNLTVIDTGALLDKVQHVVNQVIDAVQSLFVFTLAAGLLVLYAALSGTRDERMRESGVLRALGASAHQIGAIHRAELVTVGALAGLLAAAGAALLGWLLAREVFDFSLALNPWLVLAGVGGGILCALAGGWSGLRTVLRQSALRTLREI